VTEPNHNCPVCRCKWVPSGPFAEGKTQSEAIFNNVQRMAAEIRVLRRELFDLKHGPH